MISIPVRVNLAFTISVGYFAGMITTSGLSDNYSIHVAF
jgi:hypothetical protein